MAFIQASLVEGLERPGGRSAGVGNEDVEPAKSPGSLTHQPLRHFREGCVSSQADRLDAGFGGNDLGGGGYFGLVAAVDGHPAAFFGQGQGGGVAQPACGAGDEGTFIFEL